MNAHSCSSDNSRDLENLREMVMNLREKNNILEDDLGALRLEKISLEVDRRRLERELKIKDDTTEDLNRDLSLSKEAQMKAMKRYDMALEDSREAVEKFHASRLWFDEEMGKLSGMKEELEGLRHRNEGLMVEKGKMEGLMEELRVKLSVKEGEVDDHVEKLQELKYVEARNVDLGREMARFKAGIQDRDKRIEELVRKNAGLEARLNEIMDVICDEIKAIETGKMVKIEELEKEKEGLQGEKEGLEREKEGLEREKREIMAEYKLMEEKFQKLEGEMQTERNVIIEELRKQNAALERENMEIMARYKLLEDSFQKLGGGMETERNVNIEELRKENAGLEREKREIMAKYKLVEESFRKLEGDVITSLCLNVRRDERFASSKIGKIISAIINVLDAEQENGVVTKAPVTMKGNLEADPGFAGHANDIECSLKAVTKSEVARRIVISEEELSGENGATCIQKNQSPGYISISDSDDEEISFRVSRHKRERASSMRDNQNRHCSLSDESLNQKRMKKLECVLSEPAKDGQQIAASDCSSHHTFSSPNRQTVPSLRESKENNSRKVTTHGMEGNGCKFASKINKTGFLKYVAKCQQKREKNVLDRVADMVCACDNHPGFCAKAICALNRKGVVRSGQKGFEKRDIDRATAVAEYLVDSDQHSYRKKVVELKQRDPEGLDICRKLARAYSDKLFEIFKSNEDVLFSHLSADLQNK